MRGPFCPGWGREAFFPAGETLRQPQYLVQGQLSGQAGGCQGLGSGVALGRGGIVVLAFGFPVPGLRIMGNRATGGGSASGEPRLREKHGLSLLGTPSLREETQPLSRESGTATLGDRDRGHSAWSGAQGSPGLQGLASASGLWERWHLRVFLPLLPERYPKS